MIYNMFKSIKENQFVTFQTKVNIKIHRQRQKVKIQLSGVCFTGQIMSLEIGMYSEHSSDVQDTCGFYIVMYERARERIRDNMTER